MNPKQTLGDLLYADAASAPLTEAGWTALIEAISEGNQDALRTLYLRTHRIVFTLSMRICHQRESAEEVTLDVFHDVWRRAGDYDATGGSVLGWLMIQTRSRAIDRVRFEQRKKRVAPQHVEQDAKDPGTTPEALATLQRRRALDEALRTLTSDEREAIETAYFTGLTYVETAERLAQPIGTVKTRMRSALAKLRAHLGKGEGS